MDFQLGRKEFWGRMGFQRGRRGARSLCLTLREGGRCRRCKLAKVRPVLHQLKNIYPPVFFVTIRMENVDGGRDNGCR